MLAFRHPDMHYPESSGHPQDRDRAELETRNAGSGSRHDDVIAWRGERRFVRRLSRATIDVSKGISGAPGASYVVTGGLGSRRSRRSLATVDRGAGGVVLNWPPSDSTDEQCNVLAVWARAEIVVVRGDVASPGWQKSC